MKLDFNKKYTTIAVYAFLVIAASITFFYLINEHTTVSRVLGMVFNLMMPFIYGAALAYILNPILNCSLKFSGISFPGADNADWVSWFRFCLQQQWSQSFLLSLSRS